VGDTKEDMEMYDRRGPFEQNDELLKLARQGGRSQGLLARAEPVNPINQGQAYAEPLRRHGDGLRFIPGRGGTHLEFWSDSGTKKAKARAEKKAVAKAEHRSQHDRLRGNGGGRCPRCGTHLTPCTPEPHPDVLTNESVSRSTIPSCTSTPPAGTRWWAWLVRSWRHNPR
jgi:hypothetical protein